MMRFEFDPRKSAKNLRERNLPFGLVPAIFDGPRIEWIDRRKDYGEERISTLGVWHDEVYFVAYTSREEVVRIISFRKAKRKEARTFREHYHGGSKGLGPQVRLVEG